MKWILLAVLAISLCSVSGYRIFPLRIYPEKPDEVREVTITESVVVKQASDQRKFSVGAAVRVIPPDNVVPSQRVASEGSATADGFTNAFSTERDLVTENYVTTNKVTTTENPTINIDSSQNVASPNDFLTKNVGPEYVVYKGDVPVDNEASTEISILTENIVTKSDISTESETTTEIVDVTEINAVAKDNITTTNSLIGIDTDMVTEGSPNFVDSKKAFDSENVITISSVVTESISTTENATQIENIDAVSSATIEQDSERTEHTNVTEINTVAEDNITTTKSTVEIDTAVTIELTTIESTKEQNDLSQNIFPTESVDLKTNAPAKESITTENISSSESTSTENGLLLKTEDVTVTETDSSTIANHANEENIKSSQKSDDTEIIVGNVVSILDNIFLADSSIETVDTNTTESTKKSFTANSVGVSPKTVPSEISPMQNNISSKNVYSTAGAPLKVNIDFTTEETISPKSYESFGIFTFLVPPKTEFRKNEPDPRYDY